MSLAVLSFANGILGHQETDHVDASRHTATCTLDTVVIERTWYDDVTYVLSVTIDGEIRYRSGVGPINKYTDLPCIHPSGAELETLKQIMRFAYDQSRDQFKASRPWMR